MEIALTLQFEEDVRFLTAIAALAELKIMLTQQDRQKLGHFGAIFVLMKFSGLVEMV